MSDLSHEVQGHPVVAGRAGVVGADSFDLFKHPAKSLSLGGSLERLRLKLAGGHGHCLVLFWRKLGRCSAKHKTHYEGHTHKHCDFHGRHIHALIS